MLAQHASFDLVDKLQTHKSSISSDSSRLVKQVAGQFAPDAQVLYVPTGAGGNGHSEIESFLKNCAHQSHVIEDEQTISRTVGDLMIVEESILRLRHSDQVDWLLPGVRATNKQVVVPLVTIVNFNSAGMIKAKRVYWDQASVLRQIGVLPRSLYCRSNSSEVVLPIQDASIVSGLEGLKIDNARILKMAGDRNFPDMSEMDQPASKVYDTAVPQGDEPKPSPRRAPVFDDNGRPPSGMPSRMSSALSFTDDAEFAARPSSRFLAPPGGISNIFNDNADPIRPSSRVLQRPGGSTSDIFSTEPVVQRAIPADPRRYQSSFDEQPLNTIQSRGVNRRDPNQTSAQADEIKSMGRRTANASDESLPEEISHGRKHYGGGGVSRESVSYEPIHGKKHFDESSRESLSVLSATGSRSTTPNSEFALAPPQFGRGGRRDPNARSEEAVHRPSSR